MKQINSKRMKIYYDHEAFSKIVRLVLAHKNEIGWNMVVKPYKEGYKVFDVVVYPQKTFSGYISVNTAKYGMWKADLTDEQDANLFGQGHSHVYMAVNPSQTDKDQQAAEIQSKQSGFYLFQIWNKRLEINTFFYDLDNNLLYESSDIDLIIEEDEFITNSWEMLDTSEENEYNDWMKEIEEEYEPVQKL